MYGAPSCSQTRHRSCGLYCVDQVTWYCLSSLPLHTAVIGTVRTLRGPGRHGQAMLYLFQKHLLCWGGWEYIVYCNGIAAVRVKFCVVLEFRIVKNLIASKKLQNPAGYEVVEETKSRLKSGNSVQKLSSTSFLSKNTKINLL